MASQQFRYDTQGQQRAMDPSQKYVYNQRVTLGEGQPRNSQILTIPSDYHSQQPGSGPIPRYVAELEPAQGQPPAIYRPVQTKSSTYNPEPARPYVHEPVQTYPAPQPAYMQPAYQPAAKPQAHQGFSSGAFVGQTDGQLLTGPYADRPHKQLCIRVTAGIVVTLLMAGLSVLFLKLFYEED